MSKLIDTWATARYLHPLDVALFVITVFLIWFISYMSGKDEHRIHR